MNSIGRLNCFSALEGATTDPRPWLRWYGKTPADIAYPEVSLYEALSEVELRVPDAIAWDYFDTTSTYSEFLQSIDQCADMLSALGLKAHERILIAMPNTPQGIIAFYAANKLGAVPALVHPLAMPKELEHYLNASKARIALTLDVCYERFASAQPKVPLETLVLARISDYLPPLKRIAFALRSVFKMPRIPCDRRVKWWQALRKRQYPRVMAFPIKTDDPAAVLFSGGTTGTPKGIVLSNRNFIAEGMAAGSWLDMKDIQSIFAVMPIFHGFGLSLCVNAPFMIGGKSILVPTPNLKLMAQLLKKKRPNIIVGVPTLYSALTGNRWLKKANLACLHAAFSGADVLLPAVKEEFEQFVAQRGGSVKLLEGYGLSETVSAVMAMPPDEQRQGSIGIPLPGVYAKICKPGTQEELLAGEEGEICLAGPTLMIGYLDDPEATASAMRKDADGRVWLHTGDIGKMDADGFFYFRDRLKRVIKSSGFSVFPSEVEAVLCSHPLVRQACVVGVPDPLQVEEVKAYIVLKDQALANSHTERDLIDHCRAQLIKWSCPREIEFRTVLPQTRLGKIDYRALVKESQDKIGIKPDLRFGRCHHHQDS